MAELTTLTDLMDMLKSIKESSKDGATGSYQDKVRELENITAMSGIALDILRKYTWQITAEAVSDMGINEFTNR